MTTVVDELVIKLGLDNTSFRQQITQSQENVRKVSDEAQKQAKLIEAAGDRAASFFTKLRNEALALFALFIGTSSIKNFIQQTTLANAALGQTAKNIGMTTRELSAWQMAAERSQGSAEGLTNSMRSLSQDFQTSLLTGQATQSMNVLAQMGIAVEDPHHPGQMRPIDEIYKDVADRMKGMTAPQQQALGKMINMDEGTINLIAKGRAEIDKLLEEMRRLGTVSDEDAKVAQDLINSFKGVSDAITDVGRAILRDVSPYLTAVLTGMKDWIVQNKEWLKAEISTKIKEFGDWLKAIDWKQIHKDIDDFLEKVNNVVEKLGGWERVLTAIFLLWAGSKFAGMIAGLRTLIFEMGPLVAAFLAIKTAIDAFNAAEAMAGDPTKWSPNSPFWRDMSKEDQLKYPNSPASREAHPGPGRQEPMSGPGAAWDWTLRRLGIRTSASSEGRARESYDFWTANGYSPSAASGMVAQEEAESGFDWTQTGDSGQAHGAFQWHDDRRRAILAATGIDIANPNTSHEDQLRAALWEQTQGGEQRAGGIIRASASPRAAGDAGSRYYERPGDTEGQALRRGGRAEYWHGRFGGTRPDPALLRGSQAAVAMNNSRTTTTTNTSDSNTHINGPINIQTAATDADGIAKGIGPALRKYLPVQEANYGLA